MIQLCNVNIVKVLDVFFLLFTGNFLLLYKKIWCYYFNCFSFFILTTLVNKRLLFQFINLLLNFRNIYF